MKKYLMLFLALAVCVTVLPIIALQTVAARKTPIIRVESDGEINEISVEEYALMLMLDCAPALNEQESLKALAVSARSCAVYLSYYGCKHESFDVCSDGGCCFSVGNMDDADETLYARCQTALSDTYGQVLYYEKMPAMALYTLCAGSGSADCEEFEYLVSVPEPARCEIHKTELDVDNSVLSAETLSDACLVYGDTAKCEFAVIDGRLIQGKELQSLLGLPSQEMILEIKDGSVTACTYGIGHCYGLSLCGADGKSAEGMSYEEILKYYYPELSLNKIYRQ